MTLVTRPDLTETSPCTPFSRGSHAGFCYVAGKTTTVAVRPTHGASLSSVSDGASRHGSRAPGSRLRGGVSRRVDAVTRRLPAGRHVYNRGSPDEEEAGCPARRTRVPPGWPIRVPVVRTGLHGPSVRTTSVSIRIEVEGLAKRHRDKAGAMVSVMAMPGTARDPLRSHAFTQCRSARSRSAGRR